MASATPDVSPGTVSLGASLLFQNERQRHLVPLTFFQERSIISVAEVVVLPLFPIHPLRCARPLCLCFELATHFAAGTEGQRSRVWL
ncbi:hypothetical protein BJV78DRAFT_101900 [Lactifluus subvellereus]|nr:hypothetical protein BJV78DRAFT_101900 [Lactifluus subvellereus]